MIIKSFIKQYGIVIIIAVFFLLTLTGIFYNLGVNIVGDELPLMSATLKMISDQTLRPNYQSFYHVPLAVYIYLPFFIIFLFSLRLLGVFTSFQAIKEFGVLNYLQFVPFARFITILMGAFSIYLLYKICLKLFKSSGIALLASSLFSSSLLFVQTSHFARVWVPQTMAVMLAFYFIVVLYQRERDKITDYIFAGLGVGLALGTHVIGVLIYLPFLAAHYLKNSSKKFINIFLFNKNFWTANLVIIIFYFLILFLNPYGFHNYLNRDGGILPNFNFLFPAPDTPAGLAEPSIVEKLSFYPVVLFQYEPLLTLLFIFGAGVLFFRSRKIFYIVASFIFIYYIGASFAGLVPRYILPAIPFIALAGGYGLYFLYLKINKTMALAIISLILALNFIPPIIWDYRLIQPSTIVEAKRWIYNNIPAGSKIIDFDFPLDLNENKQTIIDIKNTTAQFNIKRSYLSTLPENDYPKPNYYLLYASYYEKVPRELLDKKYDYLIIVWDTGDLNNKLKVLENLKLKQNYDLIKKFPENATENNFSMDMSDMINPIYNLVYKIRQNGPTIYIYKMQ